MLQTQLHPGASCRNLMYEIQLPLDARNARTVCNSLLDTRSHHFTHLQSGFELLGMKITAGVFKVKCLAQGHLDSSCGVRLFYYLFTLPTHVLPALGR